jgi:pilus assembly protein CpaF
MTIRFDEKGKFFTNVVNKEGVQVILQTTANVVRGNIHVISGSRLKDFINQIEEFFAVTDAIVFDLDGKEVYRTHFLALSRKSIVWLLPESELVARQNETSPRTSTLPAVEAGKQAQTTDLKKVKEFLFARLSQTLGVEYGPVDQRRKTLHLQLSQILSRTALNFNDSTREKLIQEVIDELIGLDPIQHLLDDPEISEVMVNGNKQVFVQRGGKIIKADVKFSDNDQIMHLIDRMLTPLGMQMNKEQPSVDARLQDGSRLTAVIPPIAFDGPSFMIRKTGREQLKLQQLIQLGVLSEAMAEFLHACVVARLNILISGGAGSGRTTLLNALTRFIPANERIVTIEDVSELQLLHPNCVRFETRLANAEGRGAITARDLVSNALRMHPDRIILGEVRGSEALELLQVLNSGQYGSLFTLHAATPDDATSRMETMILMTAPDLPSQVVREQIASMIDVIVQISRLRDGARKVTHISELAGMEGERVVLSDIFVFEQTGIDIDGRVMGDLKPTGIRPLFSNRLKNAGFRLKPEIFGVNVVDLFAQSRQTRRPQREV